MEMFKLTVIVTAYNVGTYISKCLDSICGQTYRNLEIIVIDDGSTDDSGEIADEYASKDNRIKVVHRKNKGLVNARKQGVHLATGDYVAFVDGDDWIDKNMYETMVKEAEAHESDIIVGGVIYSGDTDRVEFNTIPEGYYPRDLLEKNVFPIMMYYQGHYEFGVTQFMWNKLYKRSLIVSYADNVDDRISDGEDVAFTFMFLLHASSISILRECHYHYRQLANSMCHRLKPEYFQQVYCLKENLEKNLLGNKFDAVMKPQIDAFIKMMVVRGLDLLYKTPVTITYEDEISVFGIEEKDTVVLYGAGIYGKHFYKKLKENSLCSLVHWVDKNECGSSVEGRIIEPPSVLFMGEYNKILLAVKSEGLANQIKEELILKGIPENKLVWNRPRQVYQSFTLFNEGSENE